MYSFSANDGPEPQEVRARLRKMTDQELLEFGQAALFMCSPGANMSLPPREPFVVQLEEARSEWKERQGKGLRSSD